MHRKIFHLYLCYSLLISCASNKLIVGSVLQCGATANDGRSDDQAFQKALKKYDKIVIPTGTYHLTSIEIPDNKILIGSGSGTVLQQLRRNGGNQDLRMLQITGSNVRIENLNVAGNLYEDRQEQNHSIFIRPINKRISNIVIKNINGKNIQGDLIYIGSYNGIASDIEIEDVSVDSCYRNGISITSGENITINRANLRYCGLYGLCLELDNGSKEIMKNIKAENILMSSLAIVGEKDNLVKNITIINSQIDHRLFLNIYPQKGATLFNPEMCLLRDCESVVLENITFSNSNYSAVKAVKSNHDYQLKAVKVKNIKIDNVQIKDKTPLFNVPDDVKTNIKSIKMIKNN
jgi:hypothetical protein